jgi:hypothetical protein
MAQFLRPADTPVKPVAPGGGAKSRIFRPESNDREPSNILSSSRRAHDDTPKPAHAPDVPARHPRGMRRHDRKRPGGQGRRPWEIGEQRSDRGDRLSDGIVHERREVLRRTGTKPGLQLRRGVRRPRRRARVPQALGLQRSDADVLRHRRAIGDGSRHGRHLQARVRRDHVHGDGELPSERHCSVFVLRGGASVF